MRLYKNQSASVCNKNENACNASLHETKAMMVRKYLSHNQKKPRSVDRGF